MAQLQRQIIYGLLLIGYLCYVPFTLANTELNTFELSHTSNVLPVEDLTYFQLESSELPNSRAQLMSWLNSLSALETPQAAEDRLVAATKLLNTTQHTRWFINPFSPVAETVSVYFYQKDGLQTGTSGLHHTSEIALQQGSYIDIPTGVTGTLLLVFDSDFYLAPVKVNLFSATEVDEKLKSKSVIQVLALGMLIALSVYNLFLYYASRAKAYLYFTLCSAVLAFAWANIIGIIKLFFLILPEYWLLPPFLISAAFSILFTRDFLDLNSISSRLDSTLMLFFWLCFVLVPITAFAPYSGILVVYATVSIVIITSIGAGIIGWRRGYHPSRFFVFAYCAFAIQSILWTLAFLLPEIHIAVSINFIGLLSSTTGCILLSLALAAKVSLITGENRRLASSLEQKVYERTEALAEANVALEHLISELQEASSAKSHFLANMSHEIRTPLTAIIGYAEGILQGDINRDEQERVLRVIAENGNHLLHIISDILDISKIEADKLEYEMQPCSVLEVLAQVEGVMAKRARDKGLDFALHYHFPLPSEVVTDPYRFRQILLNLSNNAIKFTELGSVTVNVAWLENKLSVSVEDTGVGMSEEKLAAVFDPFEQGGASIARQFGGTGLGLSISRRLAQGLGGDISAKSIPGKGSGFTVNIAAPPTATSEMLHTIAAIDDSVVASPQDTSDVPDFSGAKVLLVDDHPNNRDLIKIILNRMNVTVVEAEDGDIALQKVLEQEYDLILMDIQMPRMKGDEATEQLRSYGYELPIIALTANNMKHEIESYLSKGFNDHLAKPIVRQDFIATLSKYLNAKGSTESLFSNDEMLGLVRDYHADLLQQAVDLEHCWSAGDLQKAEEIAHRIKGAAGSFGFGLLGDKFALLEQLLKEQEQEKAQTTYIEAMSLTNLICNVSSVDIPRGVVSCDMDIELLLSELQNFINRLKDELEQIFSCLARGENNIARLYLNRILPKASKLGWTRLQEELQELLSLVQKPTSEAAQFSVIEKAIWLEVDHLKSDLANHHF
ncbi:response regulator [Planctobacterium marinum]|uniref:histidine kinase n=1 Tax=Planctobacterium marinum TaxID=1631968 RepID=A0AA48HDG5_9ALTE|nr:hypothetical protein MACH26_04940 [Planctobacterium marinum]